MIYFLFSNKIKCQKLFLLKRWHAKTLINVSRLKFLGHSISILLTLFMIQKVFLTFDLHQSILKLLDLSKCYLLYHIPKRPSLKHRNFSCKGFQNENIFLFDLVKTKSFCLTIYSFPAKASHNLRARSKSHRLYLTFVKESENFQNPLQTILVLTSNQFEFFLNESPQLHHLSCIWFSTKLHRVIMVLHHVRLKQLNMAYLENRKNSYSVQLVGAKPLANTQKKMLASARAASLLKPVCECHKLI